MRLVSTAPGHGKRKGQLKLTAYPPVHLVPLAAFLRHREALEGLETPIGWSLAANGRVALFGETEAMHRALTLLGVLQPPPIQEC